MHPDAFHELIPQERLSALLREIELPAYIHFGGVISRQIDTLRRIAPQMDHLFAVKANSTPEVLRCIAAHGLGADVASGGEVKLALEAGFRPDAITFSGPGKTMAELRQVAPLGLASINVESLDEIELLAQAAREAGARVNVGVRINPAEALRGSGLRMAGETQFGVHQDQALEAVRRVRRHAEELRFAGIHVHAGSQVMNADSLVDAHEAIMDIALELEEASGLLCERINMGGGLGVACFAGQETLDVEALREGLEELFGEEPYASLAKRSRLTIEPGRFLTAASGLYAAKALYVKKMRVKEFVILDGGMHHNQVLAGGMGQVIRRNHHARLFPLGEGRRQGSERIYTVAGSLCTPLDQLLVDAAFPCEVLPDDVIVFYNSGAYGLSASPVAFLHHPPPSLYFLNEP